MNQIAQTTIRPLITKTVYNIVVQTTQYYLSTLNLLLKTGNLNETSELNTPKPPLTHIIDHVQTFLSNDTNLINYIGIHSISKSQFNTDYIAMIILHNFHEHINNNSTYIFHTESLNTYNLTTNQQQLENLRKIIFHKQGTPGWYSDRQKMLTASACYKVIYGSINDKLSILFDKCSGEETPRIYAPALQHGTQHEDNGCNIFKKRSGRKVYEFGCISHPLFSFLGASPDGIDEMGEMLEIKMPYSRIPHECPKKDYYFQMQLQMEVCNLDVCNFLECVVNEYNSKEEYEADIYTKGKTKKERLTHSNNGLEKGVMLEGASMNNKKFFYRYSPLDIMPNKIDAWLEKAKVSIQKELAKDNLKFDDFKFRPVYWYATKYSCIRVYKDSNWINKHIAQFHKFWKTVEFYRKHGIKELEEYKKTGNSKCLPKHPGIINFPDMKVRKSRKFNKTLKK